MSKDNETYPKIFNGTNTLAGLDIARDEFCPCGSGVVVPIDKPCKLCWTDPISRMLCLNKHRRAEV